MIKEEQKGSWGGKNRGQLTNVTSSREAISCLDVSDAGHTGGTITEEEEEEEEEE